MGRPYSNPDWSPYKRKEHLDTEMHRQRKDHVRTRQVDSHLQARDKDLRRNQTCRHLLTSRMVIKLISIVKKQSLLPPQKKKKTNGKVVLFLFLLLFPLCSLPPDSTDLSLRSSTIMVSLFYQPHGE